ncbi:hypothetical protein ACS5NO_32045 [Larkinella sp. GY13]|uniref:hypothetical protein n=1 Tax=Larkinella sp. GY13 TaxID=3453720 RepID=UPI003EEE63A1
MKIQSHVWSVGDLARISQDGKNISALLLDTNRFVWIAENGACCHCSPEQAEFICTTPLRYQFTSWKEVLIDFELDFFKPYFLLHRRYGKD